VDLYTSIVYLLGYQYCFVEYTNDFCTIGIVKIGDICDNNLTGVQ